MTLDEREQLVANTTLNLAEELFVACRFEDAASVCNNALNSHCCTPHDSIARGEQATPALVVAFGDYVIAPIGTCDNADLLAAILLQCGFELGRSEDWARCRAFYGVRGAIPFAIASLW